ncbi:retrovirus-related pol polyprotein from transposon TNT 1-94 [Tanacetum coccineum]|uniref:Retrovirus-related pol polyprotein from transposon TNT 1-94 n=1 Tax=Tanacetum coccineum TaxID=301880 RepID=A0ABQ4XFZ7_9ASTR
MLMYSTLPMKPLLFTTEEKTQKKNDVKARSMLLMELPNEYLLTFNQYKDAKTLVAAIQTRFGGNDATKNTQKTLLKQMYENFNAPSTESLDSIFNRLQKIVSQLAILDLDSMSFDDLYNNFKIVEQEVKRTATSSISSSSQNMAFVSSPSSINKVNTANVQVSTANSSVSNDSTLDSTANLSDATVYAFLANQPNGSQLVYEDLEQIHEDDLKEMDLKWQLALLSMRARRECKSPRNQESRPRNHDNGNRNQDSSRRTMNLEETSSKVMVAIDGAGFDWSFMAEEEVTTTMALMAFSNSEGAKYLITIEKAWFINTSNEVKKTHDTPLVKELVSEKEKQPVCPTKIEFVKQQDKIARKPVKVNYNYTTNRTHPNAQRNMVPRAVLMKTCLKLFNTARTVNTALPKSTVFGNSPTDDQGYVDSGYSRHMTGNISYLLDFQEFYGGYVTFGGGVRGVKITGKCTLKMGKLDFQDLPDESQILLKIPRKKNMYSVDIKNIVPKESLTCLVAKATLYESMLWHRRLGHVNFKTINKLVKDNILRGLPSKHFENDQTCVVCLKGKQHKASCKSKVQNSITQPLFMLHMDLFGLTFVSSLMNKKYCLVVTEINIAIPLGFSFSLKDESSGSLKNFIADYLENLVDKKVKIIRCDNGTEFKNRVMNEFCEQKGIKREYNVARTPQQNGVAKRRNRTLIEAARTIGITPALSFMRPFGCHVSILNTLDHLGKFDGKSDEGFFVGYSLTSKAFRVYNIRTRRVEENLHIRFLEDKPIISGDGPKWLFDLNSLTKSMNYVPVIAGTNSNDFAGSEVSFGEGSTSKETDTNPMTTIVMPLVSKESRVDDQEKPESSTLNINTVGPSINIASANLKLEEPKRVTKALSDSTWVEAIQEELLQFKLQEVWVLVDLPKGKRAIGTKWIFRNKKDERGIVIRNKARLVAQGYTQEEGIDYDEVFAPIARIKVIRLFLAYASFMGFMVYQMDVKSAFLYGKIEEEVYVCQPPEFEDPNYPDKVYKVVKELYGLHQAPRAWYETLTKYLLDNGFHRGKIDQTLFIKKQKGDILLVHVYVDDIIFGSKKKELCLEFENLTNA